jgi:alanyl-tRNA synthetase
MPFVSHVTRTGDIKDFVITEESGIAKGIRRITAVTGHEAEEVTRIANSLQARLDQVEAMSGKEKEAGLKAFSVVCSLSIVPSSSSYTPNRSSVNRKYLSF